MIYRVICTYELEVEADTDEGARIAALDRIGVTREGWPTMHVEMIAARGVTNE